MARTMRREQMTTRKTLRRVRMDKTTVRVLMLEPKTKIPKRSLHHPRQRGPNIWSNPHKPQRFGLGASFLNVDLYRV
jgi:hypothetical protein